MRRVVSRLDSDDFELFGLPRSFRLEPGALDSRRRDLLGEVHPDRFAAADAASRRAAMQWAVRVNEAYSRLGNDLARAAYLCELHGAAIAAENNTAMPAEFLMQQMAWRESLDEAETPGALDALWRRLQAERSAAYEQLAHELDVAHDFPAAAMRVRALMFVERVASDVADRRAALER